MSVLLDMQDSLYRATKDPDCEKYDLARLALAWERLEERRRIMKGKPLPGALKPASPKKRGRPGGITVNGHVLELPDKVQEPPAKPESTEPPSAGM